MRHRDKKFKEPNSILFKKRNKDKIVEILFYLENDDGHQVNFNGESLKFTIVLLEI